MSEALTSRLHGGPSAPGDQRGEHALAVAGLAVFMRSAAGEVAILSDVALELPRGRVLGVAGESGCGKSTLALAVSGLLGRRQGRLTGSAVLDGIELVGAPERELRRLRGRRVGFIPQDPMAALNPTITVGRQLMEAPIQHLGLDRRAARERALELCDLVQLPLGERILASYPHQLSGGMRQRVMIAIALSCSPALVVADEPTTALDVTVQAEILDLFGSICRSSGTALLIVSHDLSVLDAIADEIAVLYAGEVVERGRAGEVVGSPLHPYTQALLRAIPDLDDPRCRHVQLAAIKGKPPAVGEWPVGCRFAPRCRHGSEDDCATVHPELVEVRPGHLCRSRHAGTGRETRSDDPAAETGEAGGSGPAAADAPAHERRGLAVPAASGTASPLVEVHELTKRYRRGHETFAALRSVSLSILEGSTYGLVGESGSGKSTLAHCVLQLARPYEGTVSFASSPIDRLRGAQLRAMRRHVQVIFQDARNSLDSRKTLGWSVAEPLAIHEGRRVGDRHARVARALDAVGLPASIAGRYPRQCSGGELQRACIARALVLSPRLLVCDEAVTSLDVSNRAQVLNVLRDLQRERGLTMLFISHDFATIRAVADTVGVMRAGHLVEEGPASLVLGAPREHYTRHLLEAVPRLVPAAGKRPRPSAGSAGPSNAAKGGAKD